MLQDSYGRNVDYLRVSVTERCNFRCQYCMPDKPFHWAPKEQVLSYEELFEFIKISIDNGITKIRLTGGEPTVRDDLDELVRMITDYAPAIDLAMTTNGHRLAAMAQRLKEAGLKRINISLDSLDRASMHYITQKDAYDKVIQGIEAALEAGLKVKINSVIMKDVNDHEILPLFEYAKSHGIQIRFIEYMENTHASTQVQGLDSDAILERIGERYPFAPLQHKPTGPATIYETLDGYQFGIIAPHRHDFCETCNRIRLTAEGDLIPCLYFDEAMSIKDAIRSNNTIEAENILHQVVWNKPEKNRWETAETTEISARAFYQTGG